MKFIDSQHKKFWNEKIKQLQKRCNPDVYYKSIIYTLGICDETRRNFNKIFNLDRGEINIDSLNEEWQTGTSAPYFYEAIKLRYPEYTREKNFEREL